MQPEGQVKFVRDESVCWMVILRPRCKRCDGWKSPQNLLFVFTVPTCMQSTVYSENCAAIQCKHYMVLIALLCCIYVRLKRTTFTAVIIKSDKMSKFIAIAWKIFIFYTISNNRGQNWHCKITSKCKILIFLKHLFSSFSPGLSEYCAGFPPEQLLDLVGCIRDGVCHSNEKSASTSKVSSGGPGGSCLLLLD